MKSEVYILHGWAIDENNQSKWDNFRVLLREQGVATHFLEIPGLSSPLNEVWDLNDYVDWLKNQLKGKENIVLLGHSFGGQIAIRYTAKNQQKVKKLILIDSSGIIDRSFKKVLKRNVFAVVAKLGKRILKGDLFRIILYKLARERDYLEASESQRKTMANVISEEIVEDLPKINIPTLIIWGENDMVTPYEFAQILKKQIKNSKLFIIKNARHAPQFTHSEETSGLVGEFLQGTK